MCGICGFVYDNHERPADVTVLERMRDSLVHRGPDDKGYYAAPGIGLASRRLAILDLSGRGRMPMSTPDGRYHIVYNGEVYNCNELRRDLEAAGQSFVSRTDTEVILYLYVRYGPAMLDKLNGMFAFAIWDAADRRLFLARDRLGVKPLYYVQTRQGLFFASEEKAFFEAGIGTGFDEECWEELLCFRYVAGERTPFRKIRRLLPGHTLTWRNGIFEIRRWWTFAERIREKRSHIEGREDEWFRETFDDSVSLRRIADVPVGVLLSGGLDSSSVAASLATRSAAQLSSFTVRFTESAYDEGDIARTVAGRYGLDHHELVVRENELVPLIEQAAHLNDEPLAHASDIHVLAISRYSKRHVTVLLSGEGSDETLGGYVRYKPFKYPAALAAARMAMPAVARAGLLNGRLRKLGRLVETGGINSSLLFNACDVLPQDLAACGMGTRSRFPYREQVIAQAAGLYPGDYVRQAMFYDQHTFLCSLLDRNDRMTMGASIECRVPFLDYRLVEGLAALPSKQLFAGKGHKPLLRRALGSRLPEEVLTHRKWGFGVPWGKYLRTIPELRARVADLPIREPISNGPFERTRLRRAVSEFLASEHQHTALITQLFMISTWHDAFFTERTRFARTA
jgi:asparagine synthase (glutamine-hydrolysing)